MEIFNVYRVWSWLLVSLSFADDVELRLQLSDARSVLFEQLPSILQDATDLVVSILDGLVGKPARLNRRMVAMQIGICYLLDGLDGLESITEL